MQVKHPLLTQHCPPNLEIFESVRSEIHPTARNTLFFTWVTLRKVPLWFASTPSA